MIHEIRNIGIFAHADAGKTTVTENLLFVSGKIKKLGSVDKGTAKSDFTQTEKTRGISVHSSYSSFIWKNCQINLTDTPGHVDFSAEAERSMRIIDAGIIVISAVEGVQAHTETIWNGLKKRGIPVLFFINKTDRIGADTQLVIEELEKELTSSVALLQETKNEAADNVSIKSVWNKTILNEKIIENLAESNDEMLALFLEGNDIPFEKADSLLKDAVLKAHIFPVLMGSAKYSLGIEELLNAITHYFPKPNISSGKQLSALVFAVTHDNTAGKIAHVRIFDGQINNRNQIKNYTRNIEEKVTQVRKYLADSYEDIGLVKAGDIAALCGLRNAEVGDILGVPSDSVVKETTLNTPLFTVQIKPENEKDFAVLAKALKELSSEDPNLGFVSLPEEKELHVNIMGYIRIQVLESILENRFNIKAKFEEPTIIYKETPKKSGEGFVRYWMPKPCWAILKFKIEPGERDSGIKYYSELSVDDVLQKYQNEVERTIPAALKQGMKGWEVTDIKITLIEGEDHPVHSRAGDFVIAAPMGIMNGLENIGTTLLEPVVSYKITADESLLGKIVSDITKMRGQFNSPDIDNGIFILKGTMPLTTSSDYPIKLSSRSGGKAKISTKFHSYQICNDKDGQIREYKGISPLDTAKYILKARKAIQ